MKTKEEVLKIVKEDLVNDNTLVIALLGFCGTGLKHLSCDTEKVDLFYYELTQMSFDGVVGPSKEIQDSKYWNKSSVAYQFSGERDYKVQIKIDES